MQVRLWVGKSDEPRLRINGTDLHLTLQQAIRSLPDLVAATETEEVVLSVYVWPYHFAHDSGFLVSPDGAAALHRHGCNLNVVFMANNAGPSVDGK